MSEPWTVNGIILALRRWFGSQKGQTGRLSLASTNDVPRSVLWIIGLVIVGFVFYNGFKEPTDPTSSPFAPNPKPTIEEKTPVAPTQQWPATIVFSTSAEEAVNKVVGSAEVAFITATHDHCGNEIQYTLWFSQQQSEGITVHRYSQMLQAGVVVPETGNVTTQAIGLGGGEIGIRSVCDGQTLDFVTPYAISVQEDKFILNNIQK